ncbi:aldo/keto reductase [Trebonia kvetii]|uniref:Aldo/keto reductase n=1 Tax=Trebonia kvetii TaxID=2480626 RepID=A0A6P2BTL3_9ACTN|nr:aldo/keto reductase [Trebonia kvetii]TVZ01701.1 aldo/keto reductase [Trebonia kvetii]
MTAIGSSGLDVFPLGLGGNTFGWTSDRETSFAVLDAFVAVALQPHYNLLERASYETSLAPSAAEFGLGVLPYCALAGGFLAGKYRSAADHAGAARQPAAARYLTPAGLGVLAALDSVAADHGVSPATVALAWLLTRPGVVAPLASARTVEQLPALLASAALNLTPDDIAVLDEASAT